MLKKLILSLAAFACISLLAVDANAISLNAASPRQDSTAPQQFRTFCKKNPGECRSSNAQHIRYTPSTARLLSRINAQVNRQIRPRRDKVDVWQIATRAGDCDDYVMTKRHKLIRAGVPSSALRVAVVKTRRGEGHAVLVVKTSTGDLVLDNIRRTIVSRKASGYRYISMSTGNPLRWN